MNDAKNESVRFSMNPNPFLYGFEVTRHTLLAATTVEICIGIPFVWPGIYSEKGIVLLLISYALLGPPVFVVAFVAARHLIFILTDKRAIVRSSFWGVTTDRLSIAIESVKHIEMTSYDATYGSVYLNYDKTSPYENSKVSESDSPQPSPIQHARDEATSASVPIRRSNSIWRSMSTLPRLLGFYGFEGFDEFANIVSEQQNSVPNLKEGRDTR